MGGMGAQMGAFQQQPAPSMGGMGAQMGAFQQPAPQMGGFQQPPMGGMPQAPGGGMDAMFFGSGQGPALTPPVPAAPKNDPFASLF